MPLVNYSKFDHALTDIESELARLRSADDGYPNERLIGAIVGALKAIREEIQELKTELEQK